MTDPAATGGGTAGMAFIPGAGLGAWIWEEVIDQLELPCLAADLPLREAEPEARAELGLAEYTQAVVDQIDGFEAGRVIIVAHSLGGLIGLRAAEQLGERVAGFVGVGAAIPLPNRSFVGSLPAVKGIAMRLILRLAGTRPPESAIRKGLCSDLHPAQADEVVHRFAPESRAVYFEPVGAGPPPGPRAYVRLTADREMPTRLQDHMAAHLGAHEVADIPSGHLPMLSRPAELVEALRELAAGMG